MKNKINLFLSALLCLLIPLSLTACGNGTKKTSTVYFLSSDSKNQAVYDELAQKYKAEKGTDIKVLTVDKNRYSETLKKELEGNEAPTVFELTGTRDFEEYKDYCADMKNGKLYSSLFDKEMAIKDDINVAAVPYTVTGIGILYNDEIAKKYFALPDKKSLLSSMDEIKNFEQLKIVAEDMQEHRDALGIEGAFASVSLAQGEEERFSYHLLGTPLYYEMKEKDGDVRENLYNADELKFQYADEYKNLFDLYTDNAASDKAAADTKTAADSYQEFARGKVAMLPGDSTLWTTLSGMSGSALKAENIKMLPLYTGIDKENKQGLNLSMDGYFAINKKADDEARRAASDFLDWLFTEETGKSYVTTRLSYTAPFNSIDDSERQDDPLIAETIRHIKNGTENVIMTIDRIFPDADYYKKLGTGLRDYTAGRKSFGSLKETVTDEWKRPQK